MNWELHLLVVNQPASGELNELLARWAANGWELVNHTAPSQEYTDRWTFAFKRPASDG